MSGRGALVALLLVSACASPGPNPAVSPASRRAPLDAESLRRHLHAFAHDSMEGREAGAAGNARATAYLEREFRRLGVQPAGEGGGYFQTVPLVERRMDSSSTFATSRGTVRVGTDFLPVNLARLDPVEADVIFAGMLTDSANWIDERQITGRILLLAVSDTQQTFVPWLRNPRFAAAAAIAVAQLDLMPAAEVTRIARTWQRHLSNAAALSADSRSVPRFYLSRAAAERLIHRPLRTLKPGEQLGRASLRVLAEHRQLAAPALNVLGLIRGTDPALRRELIVIGAHNDHLGIAPVTVEHDSLRAFNTVMRPLGANDTVRAPTAVEAARIGALLDSLRRVRRPRPDSIFNGAMDDGGGTVTLLGLAETFRLAPPRRSILFVSHTAEEGGLLGSAWFTTHPTVPLDHVVAMINLDSYGGDGRAPGAEQGGDYLQILGARRISRALGDVVDSLNARRPRPLPLDSALDAAGHPLNKYCRSDHVNYARFGIPVVFFSTGWNLDYHQVTDEAEYTDFDYLARIGGFVRDLVVAIADRPERLRPDAALPPPGLGCRQ